MYHTKCLVNKVIAVTMAIIGIIFRFEGIYDM